MISPRLVLAIFILSGAAGLMYEVVWARQLVLVFGNTTQAVSAILTGFFGGMAIGSAVGGRVADRVARPLAMFGLLEIGLAAIVLITPLTFDAIHEFYRSAFGALQARPALLTAIRFGLSLIALAPATILMGATLPALTRYLTRDPSKLSVAFGRLYAANTAGAIVGTVLAGFVLIELLGLSGTLLVGAACSATSGGIALLADLRSDGGSREAQTAAPDSGRGAGPHTVSLVLLVSFVSGLTSLGYQVLWTRLLASGTGNSTYVFSAILAVFLIGLAAGAIGFSWYRSRIVDPVNFIAHGQLLIAILVCLSMGTAISQDVTSFVGAGPRFGSALADFIAVTAVAVLPATLVMGLTFPVIAAVAEGKHGVVATRAGALLAANTAGAITATIAVPFGLIPAVGSPASVGVLALINVALALGLALRGGIRERFPRRVVLASGLVMAAGITFALSSRAIFVDPNSVWIRQHGILFESREDQIASVQAGESGGRRQLWVTGTSMTLLTVDSRLMTVLPLMLRPNARSALIIAFGMGSSYRTALIAGLRTTAVELVPSVPRMFRWFYPDAASVAADPNGRIVIADGRNYMELAKDRYDIIITDPPPPVQSAGVSVIASREYYEAGRKRLNPGGVMMQWVPHGQTVGEFKAHVRTWRAVFPHVIVAEGPGRNGLFLFGSVQPISFDSASVQEVLSRPGIAGDLSSAFDSPARSAAEWAALIRELVWLDGAAVDDYAGTGPLITDDRPLPEYFLVRHMTGAEPRFMTRADIVRTRR